MADALAPPKMFTIVDPLHHDDFVTSRGTLKAGEGGYITTRDRDLAQEIQQREPWAIVTEHEVPTGGAGHHGGTKRGGSVLYIPAIGIWADKKYWFEIRDEKRARERKNGIEIT
jgi:hypothetical protein